MKTLRIIPFLALTFIFVSCNHHETETKQVDNEALLYATLYQQKSAETAALYHQAFNFAELRLNQILADNPYDKPLAIVVDVDETVLDNTPFEAKSILENTDYPTYWGEWCELASAKALPGAAEFLNYAASKGVETFYVTNRKIEFQEATMKNLAAKGFPFVDEAHMFLRTTESSKEPRRLEILRTHKIVILMGDNLNDFTDVFEGKSREDRHLLISSLRSEFGKKFIVLPNPMYGEWVNALLNYEKFSKEEKIKKLKETLEAF